MDEHYKKTIPASQEMAIKRLKAYHRETETLMTYYQCALLEVETKIKVLDKQFSLDHERNPIDSIQTRLKSLESIVSKLERRNLPVTLSSIETYLYDVAGIRVICSFVDDIYKLVDCLKKQDDIHILEIKDYIAHPKENGYRSLHMIIEIPIFLENEKKMMKVEIQLRTIAMEFWANLEHQLRYKKNLSPNLLKEIGQSLSICAEISAALDLKMQNIRHMIDMSEKSGE